MVDKHDKTLTAPIPATMLPPKDATATAASQAVVPSLTEAQMQAFRAAFESALIRSGSQPPPALATPAPSSSMRAAAKTGGKLGKWGTLALGVLAFVGQVIVWIAKPEYAGPIVQAIKVIASLAGGAPSVDNAP